MYGISDLASQGFVFALGLAGMSAGTFFETVKVFGAMARFAAPVWKRGHAFGKVLPFYRLLRLHGAEVPLNRFLAPCIVQRMSSSVGVLNTTHRLEYPCHYTSISKHPGSNIQRIVLNQGGLRLRTAVQACCLTHILDAPDPNCGSPLSAKA